LKFEIYFQLKVKENKNESNNKNFERTRKV